MALCIVDEAHGAAEASSHMPTLAQRLHDQHVPPPKLPPSALLTPAPGLSSTSVPHKAPLPKPPPALMASPAPKPLPVPKPPPAELAPSYDVRAGGVVALAQDFRDRGVVAPADWRSALSDGRDIAPSRRSSRTVPKASASHLQVVWEEDWGWSSWSGSSWWSGHRDWRSYQ